MVKAIYVSFRYADPCQLTWEWKTEIKVVQNISCTSANCSGLTSGRSPCQFTHAACPLLQLLHHLYCPRALSCTSPGMPVSLSQEADGSKWCVHTPAHRLDNITKIYDFLFQLHQNLLQGFLYWLLLFYVTYFIFTPYTFLQFKSKLLRPTTLLVILYITHPTHLPVFNTYNSRPSLTCTFCFSSLESCRLKLFFSIKIKDLHWAFSLLYFLSLST